MFNKPGMKWLMNVQRAFVACLMGFCLLSVQGQENYIPALVTVLLKSAFVQSMINFYPIFNHFWERDVANTANKIERPCTSLIFLSSNKWGQESHCKIVSVRRGLEWYFISITQSTFNKLFWSLWLHKVGEIIWKVKLVGLCLKLTRAKTYLSYIMKMQIQIYLT